MNCSDLNEMAPQPQRTIYRCGGREEDHLKVAALCATLGAMRDGRKRLMADPHRIRPVIRNGYLHWMCNCVLCEFA